MLRIDVIRSLASNAGVPELNLKDFAEVFLRKLTEVLIENDVFYLKNLGYFKLQTLKGKVQPSDQKGFKAILFSEKNDFTRDVLVFGVPETPFRKKDEIDSLLSLSISKPVIPLNPVQFSEKSLLHQPEELEKLFDFKTEEILGNGEFLRDNKVIEISRRNTKAEIQTPNIIPDVKDEESISVNNWKFGDDWTKELDENRILSATENDRSFWEASPDNFEEPNDVLHVAQDKLVEDNITFEDLVEEEFSAWKVTDSPSQQTKELKIDLSELTEEDTPSGFANTNEIPVSEDAQNFDMIFKKSLAQNVLTATLITPPPEKKAEEDSPEDSSEQSGLFPEEGEEDNSGIEGAAFTVNAQVQELPRKRRGVDLLTSPFKSADKKKYYSGGEVQKSGKTGYVLFAILCVAVASFVYYNNYGIPSFLKPYFETKEKEIVYEIKVVPTVIERDYDIPVSYPYPGAGSVEKEEDGSKLPPPSVSESEPPDQTTKEVQPIPLDVKTDKPEMREEIKNTPPVAEKKSVSTEQNSSYLVKGNIFREGNFYVIQIFATKRKSEAENEVARLKGKGIAAYVMEADIPNRGTWYRVRIGTFNTFEEASDFSKTIK